MCVKGDEKHREEEAIVLMFSITRGLSKGCTSIRGRLVFFFAKSKGVVRVRKVNGRVLFRKVRVCRSLRRN